MTADSAEVLPDSAMQSSDLLPEIATTGDVILQNGDNYTIDCIGSAPLMWQWVPSDGDQVADAGCCLTVLSLA